MFYMNPFEEENFESNEKIENVIDSINRIMESFNIKPITDRRYFEELINNFNRLRILEKKVEKLLYYLNACGEECMSVRVLQSVLYIHFPKGVRNLILKSKLDYHNFLIKSDKEYEYINVFPISSNEFELLSDIVFLLKELKKVKGI